MFIRRRRSLMLQEPIQTRFWGGVTSDSTLTSFKLVIDAKGLATRDSEHPLWRTIAQILSIKFRLFPVFFFFSDTPGRARRPKNPILFRTTKPRGNLSEC
jgi:hypothetical protein